jgi:2-C-methyl-D-erythritol 2,4-cyclodiphosphate synthase
MAHENRFGIGMDSKLFSDSGTLTLVGAQVPEIPALTGYPAGDVLVHSISDSMLGALALGSFADLFPESDNRFQKLPSPQLLEKTYDLIRQEGYFLNNLDSILLFNKLINRNYLDAIRKNIADIFWCDLRIISLKVTSTPHPGLPNDPGGMTALTVCSLQKGKGR